MISEIALRIQQGFPGSELRLEIDGTSNSYIICFEGNELIKIDDVGVFFIFPANRKHPIKWSNVLEGGPESVARQVHRDIVPKWSLHGQDWTLMIQTQSIFILSAIERSSITTMAGSEARSNHGFSRSRLEMGFSILLRMLLLVVVYQSQHFQVCLEPPIRRGRQYKPLPRMSK